MFLFSLAKPPAIAKDFGEGNIQSISKFNANNLNRKEMLLRKATGQVFAPHLYPSEIETWDAKKADDGEYVRSHVPLQKRKHVLEAVTSHKLNGKYYDIETFRDGTSNSSNGTLTLSGSNRDGTKQAQVNQGLQYMDTIIAFGGSTGEGTIYISRGMDIDAYHRMGVKVHATFFAAPGAFGGSAQDYADFMGKDHKKTIEKLIEIAKYYGFDGWFFNDENNPPAEWSEFMKQLHTEFKKNDLEVSYYINSNRGDVYDLGDKAYDIWLIIMVSFQEQPFLI